MVEWQNSIVVFYFFRGYSKCIRNKLSAYIACMQCITKYIFILKSILPNCALNVILYFSTTIVVYIFQCLVQMKTHPFLKIYGEGLCSTELIIGWLQSKVLSSITQSKSGGRLPHTTNCQVSNICRIARGYFKEYHSTSLTACLMLFCCQSINEHIREQRRKKRANWLITAL